MALQKGCFCESGETAKEESSNCVVTRETENFVLLIKRKSNIFEFSYNVTESVCRNTQDLKVRNTKIGRYKDLMLQQCKAV